jgi:hypothetical protein
VITNVSSSGSYITAAGEILVVDLSNQPTKYEEGVAYVIVNAMMVTDGTVLGFEMIATSAGTVNITVRSE